MLKVRCQAQATLDAKGRLALPAPLRRAMAEQGLTSLVLTFHKGAIWGWSASDFEHKVEDPLSERDPFDDDVIHFVHALLAPAQDVDVDGQGRLRIPPPLRALAGVQREVIINSILDRIEIWDKTVWESRFEESLVRSLTKSGMQGAS